MNSKRLLLAILAVFVVLFATDFLIHGVWLNQRYAETASLWRTETEMATQRGWLMGGQLLFAITFTMLWARGFASTARLGCACMFGLFMGLFYQANTLVQYAVQPMPADIATKWFASGVLQGVILGLVAFFVYKPSCSACAGDKKPTH